MIDPRGHVLCGWCDRIATGSAKWTTGEFFASCGKKNHGDSFEDTDAWRGLK